MTGRDGAGPEGRHFTVEGTIAGVNAKRDKEGAFIALSIEVRGTEALFGLGELLNQGLIAITFAPIQRSFADMERERAAVAEPQP